MVSLVKNNSALSSAVLCDLTLLFVNIIYNQNHNEKYLLWHTSLLEILHNFLGIPAGQKK